MKVEFRKFNAERNQKVWANPANVRYVGFGAPGCATIHFANDENVSVSGEPDMVAAQLWVHDE